MSPGMVLAPPVHVEVTGPVVFLAGPIQGAPDWHRQAIALLQELDGSLHIACPRHEYPPGAFAYEAQVDWETAHLRRAAREGVILFWLAQEADHRCDRAYAQTTRFELAEWKVRHERDGAKLVVGVEAGFTGARYVRRRFSQDCPGVPVVGSLEEACRAAAAVIRPAS